MSEEKIKKLQEKRQQFCVKIDNLKKQMDGYVTEIQYINKEINLLLSHPVKSTNTAGN